MKKLFLFVVVFICLQFNALAQWTTKAPMPTARGWLSSSVVNNNIYAVGGAIAIGSDLDVVEAYDPQTDLWTTKSPMPTPRGCAAACAVDGIIYVIGGGWYTVYSTVEAYDPATDEWTTKSPMPTARSGISVCEVDGIIYAISGFIDINSNTGTNTVEAYDPKTDSWTTKAPIPTPRAFFSTSVVNGIIYAFGGFNRISAPSLGNVEAYDPVTDVWTIKNDMPNPKAGMTTCTYDGKIYLFGGVAYGGGPCYSTISKYNPASDSLEELSDMPYAVFAFSNSIVNGKIYLIGGLNTARTPLDIVYEYTPPPTSNIDPGNVSGTWTKNGSPYYVNGEITIPNDSTLTIEPGVEVVFTGYYKFNVQGRLLAIGTDQDSITFTSQNLETGWNGLRFIATPLSNDTSKIVYCKLQYGQATQGSGSDRIGGAIYAESFSKLIISRCLITKNKTSGDLYSGGGGIGIVSCSPIIENNVISYNTSSGGHGGGLFISINANPLVFNNLIYKNHSTGGAGIVVSQSNPVFINNTFTKNVADLTGGADCHGGAVCIVSCSPVFVNTILYGNTAKIGNQVHLQSGAQPAFCNCSIEGGKEDFARDLQAGGSFSGIYINNTEIDPKFINNELDDYNLSDSSSCIGAGTDSINTNNNWYYAPQYDFEGNPRPNPVGSMPDIGACESPEGIVGVEEDLSVYPTEYALSQNYPNPFNPSTKISWQSPVGSWQTLKVYDLLGKEVATLLDEYKPAGRYETDFNASNLPSGVYFYQLKAGEFLNTKKMLLLK